MTDTTDPAEAPEPVAVEEAAAPDPVEAIASRFGWRPKTDDFQGEWLDAAAFLERQPDRLKAAKEKAAKATETAQRATKAADAALRKATAQMKRQIEAEVRQAVVDGDEDAAAEAAQRLADVERTPPSEIAAFTARNAWFDSDPEARAFAIALTNQMAADGASVTEQLEAVEKAVKKRFPEHFEEAQPERPAKTPPLVTSGASSAPLSPRKKGLADVPANIRNSWTPKLCKHFNTTPQEMAEEYWKDNA